MSTTRTHRGHTIERKVASYAYARSGNAHNPTERVMWETEVGSSNTLRGAKELIDIAIDETKELP